MDDSTPTRTKDPPAVEPAKTPSESRGWQPLRSARMAIFQQKEKAAQSAPTEEPSPTSSSTGESSQKQSLADNFTFSSTPQYAPTSSCDVMDPPHFPNFDTPPDLKVSNNFAKLITNAKRVDRARTYHHKLILDPDITTEDIVKREEEENHKTVTMKEAQKTLIQSLKQSVAFLNKENKDLIATRKATEAEMIKDKNRYVEILGMKQKEVEERNLKLIVLEEYFCALNNSDVETSGDASGAGANRNDDENAHASDNDGSSSEAMTVARTASSSIVQIDKGYYTDLENRAKSEKKQRIKMEEINENLATKFAALERDSNVKIKEMTEELEKQERTIHGLMQNVKQMREARFGFNKKNGKSHRRRATVSDLPLAGKIVEEDCGGGPSGDEDEQSQLDSAPGSVATTASKEQDKHKYTKESVEQSISAAVSSAIESKEKEHSLYMNEVSKQLEKKDTIIKNLETKMINAAKSNKEKMMGSPKRAAVPKDVMLRNVNVTNELMDTSMRRLENMIQQLQRLETDNKENQRTDLSNDISPMRRIAARISLVHEEMQVSLKLIEQKIRNGAENVQQKSEKESGSDGTEEGEVTGQASGEDGESQSPHASVEDLVTAIQNEAKNALKETEYSIKSDIGQLKDQLETIQHEADAAKDTIEGLEMACAEHVENYRRLQEEYDEMELKSTDRAEI